MNLFTLFFVTKMTNIRNLRIWQNNHRGINYQISNFNPIERKQSSKR